MQTHYRLQEKHFETLETNTREHQQCFRTAATQEEDMPDSLLPVRDMSCWIASRGLLPWCRMACICSRDGHFYARARGKADRGGGGEDSFRNHAVHAANNFGQFFAAASSTPTLRFRESPPVQVRTKIAQPGQPGHSFGASSARDD